MIRKLGTMLTAFTLTLAAAATTAAQAAPVRGGQSQGCAHRHQQLGKVKANPPGRVGKPRHWHTCP